MANVDPSSIWSSDRIMYYYNFKVQNKSLHSNNGYEQSSRKMNFSKYQLEPILCQKISLHQNSNSTSPIRNICILYTVIKKPHLLKTNAFFTSLRI